MKERLIVVKLGDNDTTSDVSQRLLLRPAGSRYSSVGRFMECIEEESGNYIYVMGITGSALDPIMIKGYNFKRCDIQIDAIPCVSDLLLELIKLNLRGWDKRIHILK